MAKDIFAFYNIIFYFTFHIPFPIPPYTNWILHIPHLLPNATWLHVEPHPPHHLIGTKRGPGRRMGSEDPCPARIPLMPWTGRHGRAARHFPFSPGWASRALTHLTGDGQWAAQPGGTRATPCSPPVMGEREEGREVPTPVRRVQWILTGAQEGLPSGD